MTAFGAEISTFIADLASDAEDAGAEIGFYPSVVLAEWANETDWGTSPAFVSGHNLAGVSTGGVIAPYPDLAAGLRAYVETANLSLYDSVRAARAAGPYRQALALGASPWAASHYADVVGHVGQALVDLIVANDLTRFDPAPEVPDMQLASCEDPTTGGSWTMKPDGSVFANDGAPYLGGLNTHPEWDTTAGVPLLAGSIAPWRGNGTEAAGNGYVILVPTATAVALYRFPRSGAYR